MTASAPALPDFRQPHTLRSHIAHTMAFYHPRCLDMSGGFYHHFKDDGSIPERHVRHLVSSTRFIFVYANAWRQFQDPAYLQALQHGLRFLRKVHYDRQTGGYTWILHWQDGEKTILDDTQHCYGLAFVMLAYAHALQAGVHEASAWLEQTFLLMEKRFWQEEYGLYADQADTNWHLHPYRGQNANMHACEALLAAWQATGDLRYLRRAEMLARHITLRQSELAQDLIWEHYHSDWQVDWDYNRDDPANLFRPWGFQPGHFTEWAKLLLQMEKSSCHLLWGGNWLVPRAEQLYRAAMQHALDKEYGGLCYGFAPDRSICDEHKYFWVQAETLAASAMLAVRTGKSHYWQDYDALWAYCWEHFIDHQHGAWYRILRRDNSKISDDKSPPGKTDYHTMGACYDILKVLSGSLPEAENASERSTGGG